MPTLRPLGDIARREPQMTRPAMDLNAMAVFARVVETNGFSAAARSLGVSKSAVSKDITQLEDHMGVRLLQRTTRRLALTDAGAAFYERCARVVAEAEEAERALSQLQASPRGLLRMSAPVGFGVAHLSGVLAEFQTLYPEVQVDLQLADRLVDLVEEGFDMAVRISRLQDSSLVARKLCPMPLHVVATPQYLALKGLPTEPRDLTQHNCLLYSYAASGDAWPFRQGERDTAVHVHGNLRTNNGDLILAAVLGHQGVAILPEFMVGARLCRGELVEILSDFRLPASAVYAIYPHSRHLSTKVRVMVDLLVRAFADPIWRIDPAKFHSSKGCQP